MTRDKTMDKFPNITNPSVYRRRTMATSQIRELINSGGDSLEHDDIGKPDDFTAPSTLCGATRRMSIGGEFEPSPSGAQSTFEMNDWEQSRLDVEGFVVDYFTYRMEKDGLEWYDAPPLPYGTQPEHEVMRCVCSIFEEKNGEELEEIAEQLMAYPKVTFSVYQEIVQTVGFSVGETCPMSYGRLVGLIAFGGLVASKMVSNDDMREQVRNMAIYTSLFIKSRIRASWKEHRKTWAGFMELGAAMRSRQEKLKKVENEKVSRRRWSVFGVTAAAAVIGAVVGGRLILGTSSKF